MNVATGINTTVGSLHRLADLIVATVKVVAASGGLAASLEILSITLEAWLTQTLANRAHCIGSTLHIVAQVSHSWLIREAAIKGVAPVARFTPTVIASNSVDTNSMLAANIVGAFIDVKAADICVATIAHTTLANIFAILNGAFSMVATTAVFSVFLNL